VKYATALAILALYLGVGVFDHEIWAPVEPTVSGVVWSMVDTGDLAVPRIDVFPFLEKPPLYYWLAWSVSKVTGRLEAWTVRLPAALLGVASLAIVYALVARRRGGRNACVAVLFAAVCAFFWDSAHRAGTDIAAAAAAFLCYGLFARSLLPDADGRRSPGWLVAFCIALAASFYAKNLYTILVVAPPVAVFLIHRRRFRELAVLGAGSAILLLVLVAPWARALHEAGGADFLRVVFYDNSVGRFFTIEGMDAHLVSPLDDSFGAEKEASPLYYLLPLVALPLPWTPLLVVGLWRIVRRWSRASDYERFLVIGFATVPLVLSLSAAKSTDYLLPILFFVFLVQGELLADAAEGDASLVPWERATIFANVAVALFALVVLPAPGVALWGWSSALWLFVSVPVGMRLFARLRRDGLSQPRLLEFGVTGCAALVFGLVFLIPYMDVRKSYRPFFEDVRQHAEGRRLYTTYLNAYRTPLINYYLRQRIALPIEASVLQDLEGPERYRAVIETSLELLRGEAPVGLIMDRSECEALPPFSATIQGLFVHSDLGRGILCFAGNQPQEES
jgi:4-amino-4-deoxy-L-arabinose transferase-like glycosyltransferase